MANSNANTAREHDVNDVDWAEGNSGFDPQVVNKMLSDELNQLSIGRRQQVLEEIHGVQPGGRSPMHFGKNTINQQLQRQQEDIALKKFREELENCFLSDNKYPAYRYAKEHGSELIRDRDFELSFFGYGQGGNCPKRAAARMVNYLEMARETFGTDDVLFRPICLSDFDEDLGAREFMYNEGPLQILPVRDPSGRRVFVHLRDFGPSSCHVKIRQQVGMYFVQSISEERDGAVCVLFLHHACDNVYNRDEFQTINKMMKIIPPKFSAFHLCCPVGPMYDVVKAAVTLLIGKENRQRLRIHVGSFQECKYSLRPFGIPVDRLPVNLSFSGGSSQRQQYQNIKNHLRWLQIRAAKDTAMFAAIGRDSNGEIIDGGHQENKDIGESYAGVMAAVRENLSKFVECPRHEDCLFGKGRPAMNHPGNIAMRRLVKNKLSQFISNNAKGKSEIVQECIDEIKEWNGRFLKEDSDHAGVFVIADNETVFKKIASAFRDLKKKQLREQQREKESVRDDPGNESTGEEVGRPSQSRVKGTKRPADQEFQSSENGASSISNGNRGVNSAMAMKTYTATNDASLMTNAETDDNGSCFSHLAQRKKTRNRCFYD